MGKAPATREVWTRAIETALRVQLLARHGELARVARVLADALKLVFVGSLQEPQPRLVLAFSDADAAQPFRGHSWYAHALRELGVEVVVVDIPDDVRARIRQAQIRQAR